MKVGRNDPCLCGSGKKYKRCCLALDEIRERQDYENGRGQAPPCHCCGHPSRSHGYVDLAVADELDELSNQVPDLIRAGRLDEAEAIGIDLLNRFPGQIDGMERLAEVYEARGDLEKAIDYYRKAATFATLAPGFDPEVVHQHLNDAKRLEEMLRR